MQDRRKPLGMKNYGHVAHLPGSRMAVEITSLMSWYLLVGVPILLLTLQ